MIPVIVYPQSSERNYIKTTQIKIPVTNAANILNLKDNEMQSAVQFVDGLGRPVQTINVRYSPLKTDLVLVQEYDELGRETKKYLPFTANQNNGVYIKNGVPSVFGFYASTPDRIAATAYPYGESRFDGSDLNILKEQGAAGETWQLDQGHTIKIENLSNRVNEVRSWVIGYLKNGLPYAVSTANYMKNELYKTLLTDENGSQTLEFKDKAGRVVLKRQYVSEPNMPQLSFDTYYLYDDKGNLVMVLPPKADSWFMTHNTYDTRQLNEDLIFCYVYDQRSRMVEEKIPGKDWVYYCYDDLDRLILMQDAILRSKNVWIYTRYDKFSRVRQSGTFYDFIHISRPDVQNYYRNYDFDNLTMFNSDVFTENYYDNYDFKTSRPSLNFTADADFPDNQVFNRLINKPTGSKAKILAQNKYLLSAIYYDKYGRIIQVVADNHLDGIDVVTNGYDFEGKLLKSKQTHFIQNGNTVILRRRFEYDDAGRLTNTWLTVNNQPEVMLSSVHYNALGQMVEKNLHSENSGADFLQSVDFSYNIRGWLSHINSASLTDEHNSVIGGYVKRINYNDDANDLFGMEIFYDQGMSDLNGRPLYNGNISGMIWQSTQNTGMRGYGYQYDRLNRILKANYGEVKNNTWDKSGEKHSLTDIRYDENGNIIKLDQNGQTGIDVTNKALFGNMDKLTYTYTGNRLIAVDDDVTTAWYPNGDFNDYGKLYKNSQQKEYLYDQNGNMITDYNKGIELINYNHLNLPNSISFEHGKILYLYAATGTKLQQRTSSYDNCGDSMVKVTDYIGSFVYENRVLAYILTEEGRLVPKSDGTFAFEYFLKDHLGNTRVVFTTDNDHNGKPDVMQESSYYPYGLTFDNFNAQNTTNPDEKSNRYLFNGIEFGDELELNLYGMLYRQYDPQLGRWTTIDPKYSVWESPYLGMGGNPVVLMDLLGDSYTDFVDQDNKLIKHIDDGSNAVFQLKGQLKSGQQFFKFIGYKDQSKPDKPTKNEINLQTVINFSQEFTLINYLSEYLGYKRDKQGNIIYDKKTGKPKENWKTYCNMGTYFITKSVNSALEQLGAQIDMSIFENDWGAKGANEMYDNLIASKYLKVNLATAQKAAKQGGFVVGGWSGHAFTLLNNGWINNVGAPRKDNNHWNPIYDLPSSTNFYILYQPK